MCNLYSLTKGQAAIIAFTRVLEDLTGNLPPMSRIFPDHPAPIVRNGPNGQRQLAKARRGMPSSQMAIIEAARKRAAKIEAKGQAVDFKELLRRRNSALTYQNYGANFV